MAEMKQISPVPGLIAATPKTRPSAAWTKWLENWRGAEPDTRSPYWPIWARHQSREVLGMARVQRPSKIGATTDAMTGPEFALFRVRVSVKRFSTEYGAKGKGDLPSYTLRRDLVGSALVELFRRGLDCSRTHGEINVFIGTYLYQILSRAMFQLTSPVHVSTYAMQHKKAGSVGRVTLKDFEGLQGRALTPEEYAIMHEAVSSMTEEAQRKLAYKNKI